MTARPFSPETLADRWDCSAEKVRLMCRNGELASFRLGKALDQDEYDLFLIRHDMTGSRAYDLQGFSILGRCAAVERGEPRDSPLTHVWQYYTAERTRARLSRNSRAGGSL